MAIYEFGSGVLTGTRTDIAGLQTPRRFGVLQDVSIDFAGDTKELFGQNQYPVDTARGKTKITGKAKFAGIQASGYNDLFFGQTLATGMTRYAYNERATLGTSTTSVTYTVANATAVPLADQGVFFATGTNIGNQLTATTSAVTTGNYNFNATTGVFTIAAADTGNDFLFNYKYYIATAGAHITINQQLMGTTPRFGMTLFQIFENNQMVLDLYAAVSSKLTYPTRIDDYVINELDFSAFANAGDAVGVWNLAG